MDLKARERLLKIAADNGIDLRDDSSLSYEDSEDRVIKEWQDVVDRHRKAIEAVRGDGAVSVKGENKKIVLTGLLPDGSIEAKLADKPKEMHVADVQNAVKEGKQPSHVKPVSDSPKVDPTIRGKGKKGGKK